MAYELILIDNGRRSRHPSLARRTEAAQRRLRGSGGRTVQLPRLNNIGRSHARGSHLLLLNNDIEFRSAEVLQALLDPFAFRSTAAVGARLHYPDGSIQHQGVALVKGNGAAWWSPVNTCTVLLCWPR